MSQFGRTNQPPRNGEAWPDIRTWVPPGDDLWPQFGHGLRLKGPLDLLWGQRMGGEILRLNCGVEAGFDPDSQVNEHLQGDPAPIALQGDRCARTGMSTSSDMERPQAELCTKI